MQNILDKVGADLSQAGYANRTRDARNWLKNNLRDLKVNRKSITGDEDRYATRILPGKMYFFAYSPKLSDVLPYYDLFPLVIPIEKYNDGFLGLNLHYLPINYRLLLLTKLYQLKNNNKFDETTKLRISYDLLSGTKRYKEYEPCVKRYLYSHLRSRLIDIGANNWENAIFLPAEQFRKKNSSTVHKYSIEMIMQQNKPIPELED
jgi:hypothetical protein